MKRIYIAIFLLVFVAVACIGGTIILDKCTYDISMQLTTLYNVDFQNQKESALNLANELNKTWNKYQSWYTVFFEHSALNDITLKINRLPTLIEDEDFEGCKEYCQESQIMLTIIANSEKVSWGAIL